MNTLCILLAIVLVALIAYAIINKGKLWKSKDENFYILQQWKPCCDTGNCSNMATCP